MTFYTDPFFWAFSSMLGMQGATSMFTGHKLAKNTVFVAVVLTLVTIGRVVLVLPACPQPRFEMAGWNWWIGGIVFVSALCFGAPALSVKWFAPPDAQTRLRTSEVYAIVRHPI